jgi:hypothetical protein
MRRELTEKKVVFKSSESCEKMFHLTVRELQIKNRTVIPFLIDQLYQFENFSQT